MPAAKYVTFALRDLLRSMREHLLGVGPLAGNTVQLVVSRWLVCGHDIAPFISHQVKVINLRAPGEEIGLVTMYDHFPVHNNCTHACGIG